MSAVLALSAIGVPSGAALTISIIIGIMALVVVIALAGIALATPTQKALPPFENRRAAESHIDIDALVAWTLPVAAATAVFFQILVPSGAVLLNVNVADPIAILGGIVFVVYFLGKSWPRWRINDFNFYVIAATAVVVLSYLHGYFEFGWSDWAFRNKLLGWFILLGYGATGSLIARRAGRNGLEVLLKTFVVVAAAIVTLDLAMLLATRAGIEPIGVLVLPIEGFSQNRNAFGFLLLLAVCGTPFLSNRAQPWLLALLLLGVWFSGSRAAGGALLIIVATMVVTRFLSFRVFLQGGVAAGACLLFIAALPTLTSAILSILPLVKDPQAGNQYPLWVMGTSPDASLAQRWKSITGGFALFLDHPILGAGLGAYMEAQIKAGEPLVIHSTPIWLLAEMGIVGFGVLTLPVIRLFFSELRSPREKVGTFLILIIMAFVIMSSVHELLYQRAFWLLLGGAVACVPRKQAQAAIALNEQVTGLEPVYEHKAA